MKIEVMMKGIRNIFMSNNRAANDTTSRGGEMDESHFPDAVIETAQNTDPDSNPETAVTTGAEGPEATSEPLTPVPPPFATSPATDDELARTRQERDALLERLARLQAEFENARKREARERAEFRDFATASVVEQFLPVVDNFQLALKSGGTAEQLRSGVELIVKQMEDVLRNLQVQPIETVGVEFDPRVHEALDMVERPELPDHQVFDEVRRGYRIRERLLRPALVRVVSNPQQKEA